MSGVNRPTMYDMTTLDSDFDTSREEGHQTDSHFESHSRISFQVRRKGPKYPGLSWLQPSDGRYDKLMSYLYYHLSRPYHSRNTASMTMVHKMIKNLYLTIRERKLDGTHPILVLDFLERLVEECDTLKMPEGQALVALPHFLNGRVET